MSWFKKKIVWEDVNYHTGYYRLVPTALISIVGIPCVAQSGSLVVFTETNLTQVTINLSKLDWVIPVKKVLK
jgi:hypothetical protein